MISFSDLIAYSLDRALKFKVGQDSPVLLQVNSDDNVSVMICASFEEPVDYTVPTNVLWLVCDEEREDYGSIRRRLSKDPSNFTHTWNDIFNIEDIFSEADVWATEDLPLVQVAIKALEAHVSEQSIDDPHGLATYTDNRIGSLSGSFGAAFANLNQRVIKNRNDIDGLLALNLGEVITAFQATDQTQNADIAKLKTKISELEAAVEGRPGIPKFTHVQKEPELSWVMEHYLDATADRFITTFSNAEGHPLFPAEVVAVSNNTVAYIFAVPVAGKAVILRV